MNREGRFCRGKMIQTKEKEKCCGCTACYSVCPRGCISMQSDEEGFPYPVVDSCSCINCSACEQVCPYLIQSGAEKRESMHAAIQNRNLQDRLNSTAGGAFSLLADYFIASGAAVCAVGYDHLEVRHKFADSRADLEDMRGSKYVQSSLGTAYERIRTLLNSRQVLFAGTPCQVHGLRNYVGDHDRLFTVDLLCLGVSSPELFREWIVYLENRYRTGVRNVQFRNKRYGYSVPNVRVFFENGKEIDQRYDSVVHANLFFRHYNVRPSCYACEFREKPRVSDFTIGDFSAVGKVCREMDDDLGTTQIWVHTRKGKHILELLREQMTIHMISLDSANIIGGPKIQIKRPEKRSEFFRDVQKMTYADLIRKWEPKRMKVQVIGRMRAAVNRMPFKKYVFQYLRNRKAKKFAENVKLLQ